MRGLWQRGARSYAQLSVEDSSTGEKRVRRVPLVNCEGNPVEPAAQAIAELNRLRTQRSETSRNWPLFKTGDSLSEPRARFPPPHATPPERWLELIAEINVGHLQEIGRSRKTPVELAVEPKPEDWNPAHAEIPQNITRGLANNILRELKIHHPPDSKRK